MEKAFLIFKGFLKKTCFLAPFLPLSREPEVLERQDTYQSIRLDVLYQIDTSFAQIGQLTGSGGRKTGKVGKTGFRGVSRKRQAKFQNKVDFRIPEVKIHKV